MQNVKRYNEINRNPTNYSNRYGNKLGSLFGSLRGYNLGTFRNFANKFKNSAGIPEDAPLWTKGGGIQLGNMPTQLYNYEINPESTGLNPANNWGGLGDTYQFDETSPYAILNGLKRQDVSDFYAGIDSAKDKVSSAQNAALVNLGDVTESKGNLQPGNGTPLGSLANLGSAAIQGVKGIKGVYDNIQGDTDYNDLKDKLGLAIASNPMYDMYLTSEDENYLRKMNNGTLKDNVSNVAEGAVKGIPSALLQAGAGYLTGGIPGAIINGVGGLANSAISGYNKGTQEASAKLSGIYDRLKQAESEYQNMRRPRGLSRAGLSSNYYNNLY